MKRLILIIFAWAVIGLMVVLATTSKRHHEFGGIQEQWGWFQQLVECGNEIWLDRGYRLVEYRSGLFSDYVITKIDESKRPDVYVIEETSLLGLRNRKIVIYETDDKVGK